tara:strand:+ start:209 stop:457 length:249 start_codon:yes stop_codon:yes gene_type:complete
MANVFFLFLGLLQAEASYEIVKVPITYSAKQITCEKAFNKNVTTVNNPNFKSGHNQPMTLTKYKDKTVFAYWCKDINGKWIR